MPDRTWTLGTGAVCVALVPAFVSGLPVRASAGVAVVVLAALTGWRRPKTLTGLGVPWRTLVAVLGLFVVIETAHRHGLDALAAPCSARASAPSGCCAPRPSAPSAPTCSTTCPPTWRWNPVPPARSS